MERRFMFPSSEPKWELVQSLIKEINPFYRYTQEIIAETYEGYTYSYGRHIARIWWSGKRWYIWAGPLVAFESEFMDKNDPPFAFAEGMAGL